MQAFRKDCHARDIPLGVIQVDPNGAGVDEALASGKDRLGVRTRVILLDIDEKNPDSAALSQKLQEGLTHIAQKLPESIHGRAHDASADTFTSPVKVSSSDVASARHTLASQLEIAAKACAAPNGLVLFDKPDQKYVELLVCVPARYSSVRQDLLTKVGRTHFDISMAVLYVPDDHAAVDKAARPLKGRLAEHAKVIMIDVSGEHGQLTPKCAEQLSKSLGDLAPGDKSGPLGQALQVNSKDENAPDILLAVAQACKDTHIEPAQPDESSSDEDDEHDAHASNSASEDGDAALAANEEAQSVVCAPYSLAAPPGSFKICKGLNRRADVLVIVPPQVSASREAMLAELEQKCRIKSKTLVILYSPLHSSDVPRSLAPLKGMVRNCPHVIELDTSMVFPSPVPVGVQQDTEHELGLSTQRIASSRRDDKSFKQWLEYIESRFNDGD